METLEQLKEIYGEKPEGATHHYFIFAGSHKISNFINANTQQYWDGVLGRWVEWGGCFDDSMRLLSDIKLLIELMECLKSIEKTTKDGDVLGCWDMMKIKECLK